MISVVMALALMQSTAAPELTLPPATIALVETYADGRVVYELTSAKPAWTWTIAFPRIKDWQPPPGSLAVTAVHFDRVLVGRDIKVDVSVHLGQPHERAHVRTVLVRPGEHVLVEELRTYGVEPVDLSLAEVTPSMPYPPSVYSSTPDLEITAVDVLTAPYPGYRITVRNVSGKTAANFHVQSYGAPAKTVSSLERGREGRPVLTPGGTYTFRITLTTGSRTDFGAWAPVPLDVIEIDSVLWADGSVDGTLAQASRLIAPDAGRRLQLTRITSVLRNALTNVATGGDVLARIRMQVDALPDQEEDQLADAQISMQQTKAAALADLTRFERRQSVAPDRSAVERWLTNTLHRYERWIARLAQ